MRKYLIGIFIGVALTISSSVFAADITTLIGKAVQGVFPVTVNGDVLPKTAIVIDGTSYLPVRAIGDAIGYDVSFNADLGIELKKKEVATVTTPETTLSALEVPATTEIIYTAEDINVKIITYQNSINTAKDSIETNPSRENLGKWEEQLKYAQDQLAIWEARKAALQ